MKLRPARRVRPSMPTGTTLLAALLAAALLLRDPAGSQSPVLAPPALDTAVIDRHAERLLAGARVPAAAVAIVRGDRVVHFRGFGQDERGRPVTGETSFVLGSMSKAVTALAVMQLVEEGRIGLDEPVQRYLPAFRLATPDSGASVTVRQLLLHTSGIPHGAGRGRAARRSLHDRVAALRDVAPRSPAGAVHAYASPNYLVLGAIVEAASGDSFASYVERKIFSPLKMDHSFTERARARAHRFAGGNVYVLGFPAASSLPEERDRLPTAGLMSSAGDLARFMAMHLQGGQYRDVRLLSGNLVEQLLAGGAPSEGFSYAFGWRDGSLAGTRAVHHGGILPDFRGKMVMLPDSGWGVVVLTNASSAIPWPLTPVSHQLADDIAAHLAGTPLPSFTSHHRLFFGAVGVAMLALIVLQIRALRRAWGDAPTGESRDDGWAGLVRRNAADLGFLLFVVFLPRMVGLRWPELLGGAPDVGWWLLALAGLGAATVVGRIVRIRWRA